MHPQKVSSIFSAVDFFCMIIKILLKVVMVVSLRASVPGISPPQDDDETPHRENDIHESLSSGCPLDLIPA